MEPENHESVEQAVKEAESECDSSVSKDRRFSTLKNKCHNVAESKKTDSPKGLKLSHEELLELGFRNDLPSGDGDIYAPKSGGGRKGLFHPKVRVYVDDHVKTPSNSQQKVRMIYWVSNEPIFR